MGLGLARAEFLDATCIKAIKKISDFQLPEVPSLWMEFHGSEAGVKEQLDSVLAIAGSYDLVGSEMATAEAQRQKIRHARHEALYGIMALRPGTKAFVTDICLPISALAQHIEVATKELGKTGLIGSVLGHVGDGNFHCCILVDPENKEEIQRAQDFADKIAERAIAAGGTSTGEHGVGAGKLKFMAQEHGESLEVMAQIKRSLDPKNILNPGKTIPQGDPV